MSLQDALAAAAAVVEVVLPSLVLMVDCLDGGSALLYCSCWCLAESPLSPRPSSLEDACLEPGDAALAREIVPVLLSGAPEPQV